MYVCMYVVVLFSYAWDWVLGKIRFPYIEIMSFPETYSTLQLTPMVSQHSDIKNVGNFKE